MTIIRLCLFFLLLTLFSQGVYSQNSSNSTCTNCSNCPTCSGNQVYDSVNCIDCTNCSNVINCLHCIDVHDSVNVTKGEHIYNSSNVTNSKNIYNSSNVTDSDTCYDCMNCHTCLSCTDCAGYNCQNDEGCRNSRWLFEWNAPADNDPTAWNCSNKVVNDWYFNKGGYKKPDFLTHSERNQGDLSFCQQFNGHMLVLS